MRIGRERHRRVHRADNSGRAAHRRTGNITAVVHDHRGACR
jgi:hypothetical protein